MKAKRFEQDSKEQANRRLGVAPPNCLYVGDGSSKELSGASAVGMQPLLIRVPYEDTHDSYRIDVDEWTGRSVSDLRDVLTFAKSAVKAERRCLEKQNRKIKKCGGDP